MATPLLDAIANFGNRAEPAAGAKYRTQPNSIVCADGFRLSVIAGWGAYCDPRPDWTDGVPADYAGPYTAVEVGFPSQRPEPWDEWSLYCESPETPTETVYGYVPVQIVRDLIESHGGEA